MAEEQKPECLGRYKHKFNWVWADGVMTDTTKCINCGEERTNGQITAHVVNEVTYRKEQNDTNSAPE